MAWEYEVGPELDEVVDVHEAADVVLGSLGEDLLVDQCPVSAVAEVVAARWAAPPDPQWQLDDSLGLHHTDGVDVVGDRYWLRGRARQIPRSEVLPLSGVDAVLDRLDQLGGRRLPSLGGDLSL